jgi:hypothetical protein
MAFIGNKPYDIRLATMISQPYYHSDTICGSSFHGLATTLEKQLKNYDFYAARDQVIRCLDAREEEMRKRSYPDPAHNHAIKVLRILLNKIDNLISNVKTLWRQLPLTLVRYSEQKGFTITIDNRVFGGKIKKHKKTCKKKAKKTKTRKYKKRMK